MIKTLKENRIFFVLCLLWFIVGGIALCVSDKGAFSLWLNRNANTTKDVLFRYATWLGDGYTIIIVCIVLFFVKFRFAITTALVSFVSAFFISLLKNYYNEPRPSMYFKGQEVHFMEGLKLYQWHSFPSGHTAAAFTLFCLLAIFTKNKNYGYLYFSLAMLTAISRVYLLQHFLIDVYFGSIFGLSFTMILYQVIMMTPLFKNRKWPEGSILRRPHLSGVK